MMENSKVLISPKNIEEINKYKKIGITNFLFAIQDFSIGYPEYNIEDLKELDINIYLNINILLDTKKINDFKKLIPQLDFVKGIFFEDVGLYYLLKNENIPLIWNQAHFVINSVSINLWLEKVHSAQLANELTKEEIIYILDNTTKPIVLPVFGHNIAMYSRRALLSNFNKFHNLESVKSGNLTINEDNSFYSIENSNGTALFFSKPFNYYNILNELNDNKILFYYFDLTKYNYEDYLDIINNKFTESEEKFLNNKTIYKLED